MLDSLEENEDASAHVHKRCLPNIQRLFPLHTGIVTLYLCLQSFLQVWDGIEMPFCQQSSTFMAPTWLLSWALAGFKTALSFSVFGSPKYEKVRKQKTGGENPHHKTLQTQA